MIYQIKNPSKNKGNDLLTVHYYVLRLYDSNRKKIQRVKCL